MSNGCVEREATDLERSVDQLKSSIKELGNSIPSLAAKLDAVLESDVPKDDCDSVSPDRGLFSPIENTLYEECVKVNSLVKDVDELISRCRC